MTLAGVDTCAHALDGYCDEPYECESGTDVTDCSQAGFENGNNRFCQYTDDGECDEIVYCPAGSDTHDCCQNGAPRTADTSGRSIVAADVCCGDCDQPGHNWCQYANDGYCDEPTLGSGECPTGSDAADCANVLAICQYTGDGLCDETDYCEPGTDSADCCDGGTVKLDAAGAPVSASADCSGAVAAAVPPCPYRGDGECDEVVYCAAGSDPEDCCDGDQVKLWSTAVTGYQYHTIGTPVSNDAQCSGAAVSDLSNSCSLASNGQCDEPYGCTSGTDTLDCTMEGYEHGNSQNCQHAGDGECDEINLCPAGSDTVDCCLDGAPRSRDLAGFQVIAADVCCGAYCQVPGPGWCQYANDGQCDEPPIGGECPVGTDTTDCLASADSPCLYSDDGDCDEGPEWKFCMPGTDFNDCCEAVGQVRVNAATYADGGARPDAGQPVAADADCSADALNRAGTRTVAAAGSNSCMYANDRECDEPQYCVAGTDTADCTLFPPRTNANSNPSCPYRNDGECDEGLYCVPGSDTQDCCTPEGSPRTADAAGVAIPVEAVCSAVPDEAVDGRPAVSVSHPAPASFDVVGSGVCTGPTSDWVNYRASYHLGGESDCIAACSALAACVGYTWGTAHYVATHRQTVCGLHGVGLHDVSITPSVVTGNWQSRPYLDTTITGADDGTPAFHGRTDLDSAPCTTDYYGATYCADFYQCMRKGVPVVHQYTSCTEPVPPPDLCLSYKLDDDDDGGSGWVLILMLLVCAGCCWRKKRDEIKRLGRRYKAPLSSAPGQSSVYETQLDDDTEVGGLLTQPSAGATTAVMGEGTVNPLTLTAVALAGDMFGSQQSSPQGVLAAHAASQGQKPSWVDGTARSPGIDVQTVGAAWQPQAAMTREDASSRVVAAKIRGGSRGAAAAAERHSASLQRDSPMQSSLWAMDVEQPQGSQGASVAAPAPQPEPQQAASHVDLLASPPPQQDLFGISTKAAANKSDVMVPEPNDQWVDRWHQLDPTASAAAAADVATAANTAAAAASSDVAAILAAAAKEVGVKPTAGVGAEPLEPPPQQPLVPPTGPLQPQPVPQQALKPQPAVPEPAPEPEPEQ